ncbi:MAG: LCP family protein, partial [Frankia sp.]|nr:LCP family protein [Frankia sp.]
ARAPVATPTLPGPRTQRRQERQRRKRQKRRRVSAGFVALSLVGVAVAALLIGTTVRRVQHDDGPVARTQATLLLQLARGDGSAVESALLAQDPKTKQASITLIPSRVLTEVPGFGAQLFGRTLALPDGPRLSREAIADLVGVTVDSYWVVHSDVLTALVNRLGGVSVDVDTDVLRPVRGGGSIVLVRAGPDQRLDGARALAYATYLGKGEQELARLPRLQALLEGVVDAIRDAPTLATTLSTFGSRLGSSLPAARLASYLVAVRDAKAGDNISYDSLPVISIDTGDREPTYRIDPEKLRALVDAHLAASVPAGRFGSANRVLIENGVGTPAVGRSAARRLTDKGFVFVDSRNAASFSYRRSIVIVFDATDEARQLGERVAAALRLPSSSVRVSPRAQSVADVIVIIGADYRP